VVQSFVVEKERKKERKKENMMHRSLFLNEALPAEQLIVEPMKCTYAKMLVDTNEAYVIRMKQSAFHNFTFLT